MPQENALFELNGERFRFAKVPTEKMTWDSEKEDMVPAHHTLRTWFAHSDGGPGPGWDSRRKLVDLDNKQMLARYGHIFTPEEIIFPSGNWKVTPEGEELVGGMPDDIIYFELQPIEDSQSLRS